MDNYNFEKYILSTAELFLTDYLYAVLLDNIHSQNFPNIKTYAMTKSTRKFVILYQSRDRRLVLHFLLFFENRWMFRFSFMMSKSWPATETAKLHYNTMSLPVRLISVP